jgi:hypothetical protein
MAVDRLSLTAASNGAVTETFLHETAVSVPQLWRLSYRLPANGWWLVGTRREGGRKSHAPWDSSVDGVPGNGFRPPGNKV